MLAAPNLESIEERLNWHPYAEWGPDGVRYVCILFWNDHGYRILRNMYSAKDWERWDMSSGEFWDLFLAGCYMYGQPDHYGDRALVLAEGKISFYWSKLQSDLLAETFRRNTIETTARQPWSFNGPLE